MTKFKFQRGKQTKIGPLHKTLLISKDHTLYPFLFDLENPDKLGNPPRRTFKDAVELIDHADDYVKHVAKNMMGYLTPKERVKMENVKGKTEDGRIKN